MNYLQTNNLSKSYGDRILFTDLNISLDHGDKAALIARNGKGKSTLMRILAGEEYPDSGKVIFRNDIKVGFLSQDPPFDPNKTIWESIFESDTEVTKIIHAYEQAIENGNNTDLDRILAEMDRLQAWDFESRIKTILGKLKIFELDRKTSTLSGGQKKRVALAKLLVENPDVYLLDEPTNHLDIDMVEWLEEELNTGKKTVLLITHDRYFLDNVCNNIFELEDNVLYQYKGNYSYYLEKRAERKAAMQSEFESNQNILRRELEWVRRQPKARGTKSKSRLDAYYELKEQTKRVKEEKGIELQSKMSHLGTKIVECIKVNKAFGEKVLIKDFSYSFKRGDRIALAGANGTGKTTFLNMITGKIQPDSGKIIIGDTVNFGFYEQSGIKFRDDDRVIEYVQNIAEVIETGSGQRLSASQMLTRFDFPPDRQWTHIGKLSGGEKKRLYLLSVLMKNPNFLILDEPSNDLDILTLNKLEEFLLDYPGCILVVSHDRHFIDKICEHTMVLEGAGKVRMYPGNYSMYRAEMEVEAAKEKAENKEQNAEIKAEQKVEKPKEKVKLSYKEKLEFEKLEKEIPELEKKKTELEEKLGSTTDGQELIKISAELGKLMEEIDEKSMRWLELSEFA